MGDALVGGRMLQLFWLCKMVHQASSIRDCIQQGMRPGRWVRECAGGGESLCEQAVQSCGNGKRLTATHCASAPTVSGCIV